MKGCDGLTGFEVLDGYRKKLLSEDVNDRYAALGFALQLPGICGRLEFPPCDSNVESETVKGSDALYKRNKKKLDADYKALDKNLFIHWIVRNAFSFRPFLHDFSSVNEFAENLYDLRNAFTHEGIIKSNCEHVVIVDTDCMACLSGHYLFLPLRSFCRAIFDEAQRVFEKHGGVVFCEFSACGVDLISYNKISAFIEAAYAQFWANYSREDNALNMLYDFLFHKHDGFKNTVRLYFENNPGSDYVIENFEPRVLSDGILFFAKDYFSGIVGHMIPGIMCRFDEIQFERMLVVRDALDAYSIRVDECLKHAFDTCDFDGLCLLDL